jgi:hypothetical protein
VLHPLTAEIFRGDAGPIRLHRHQEQAVAKAAARESFAVTTGTGSGKSLCFFVPIIDAAVRARVAGEAQRTRAIVVYPMNALANSQMKELEKFLGQSGLSAALRPTFARYTGQESELGHRDLHRDLPVLRLSGRRRAMRHFGTLRAARPFGAPVVLFPHNAPRAGELSGVEADSSVTQAPLDRSGYSFAGGLAYMPSASGWRGCAVQP